MRVLVTGATGFIGSSIVRRLIADGHDVHITLREGSKPWRIADISKHVSEHDIDLRDFSSVNAVIQNIQPQVIYHLATYGGFASQSDQCTILESNFTGTINLLRACEKVGFEYFVNTGSSSEYGIKSTPMTENDILQPIDDYGVSKAAATLFCQSEGRAKGLPIVTLRLFSPYGPWDDPRRLIPYVISSLLRGESPKLSTPVSVRDYIFIDDVVNAYLMVVKRPLFGDVFNIATGKQSPIGDVVLAISKIVNNGIEPTWGAVAKRRPESSCWVATIDRAIETFGWRPAIALQNGLELTVAWMKNNLSLYR